MNIPELYAELQIMEWFVSKVRNDIKQLEECAPDGKYLSETDDEYNKRKEVYNQKEGKEAWRLRDGMYAIQDIISRIKSDLTISIINKYSHQNDIFDLSQEPTT